MNKTINVNLGGIFFHIDEEAYQKLKNYLDAIRRSLIDDPQGKDEIINDIEIRISELLSEKIKNPRQVVNVKDVESIIEIMGKPEDYASEDAVFEENDFKQHTARKKLYRDPDDKFLGGVCSGIAHYLGVDPIWVRLFWLFFAFTYGSGVLIYFLLWILLPVANTTSQKLEMEGEEVNISNIEKKIREEFKDVSNRFKEGVEGFNNEIKKAGYESKLKTGIQEIITVLSQIFKVLFKNIGKIVGVFLILISGLILLTIFISMFSIGSIEILGIDSNIVHYPPFFYDATIPKGILGVALLLLMGIPFFFLFVLGLKIVSSNAKSLSVMAKLTLLGVWLLSLMLIIFSAIETNLQYLNNATVTIEKHLSPIDKDTLKISVVAKDDLNLERNYQKIIVDNDKEKLLETDLKVIIKPSNTNKAKIVIFKKASGISAKKAKNIADEIEYSYTFKDGELVLDNYFFTNLKNKRNKNKVNIVLYLPKNKIVTLDASLKNFIKSSSFNDEDFYFDDKKKYIFKMTQDGLKCLNCSEIIRDNFVKNTDSINKTVTSTSQIIVGTKALKKIDSINKTIQKQSKHVIIDENGVKVE